MRRYIDADALLSKGPFVVRMNDFGEYFVTVEEINKMPTVDAVPVVRCGECVYYSDEYGSCVRTDIIRSDMRIIMPDWYCADGERKSND